jgi:hypothetical protein
VFLKMNSGMNRLGFTPQRYRAAWARLNALPQVDEISLMTHFPTPTAARHRAPAGRFDAATRDLPGERSWQQRRHAAPRQPGRARRLGARRHCQLRQRARPPASTTSRHWGLQPAMTLRTRLIAVQQLQPGDTVGYGSSFTAAGPMRIGIAACGYADGYPRHCGTGTPVLVDGVRTRTVGRVSAWTCSRGPDPVPQAGMGSEVTLWGPARPAAPCCPSTRWRRPPAHLGYELMCALAPRVPVCDVGGSTRTLRLATKPTEPRRSAGCKARRLGAKALRMLRPARPPRPTVPRRHPAAKTEFTCSDCGGSSPKWLGKCPSCGAWNTLVEGVAERAQAGAAPLPGAGPAPPVATLSRSRPATSSARPPARTNSTACSAAASSPAAWC